MGCFGYICPICKKSIRSGEKCVLIHKRNGIEIGRTEGHYDSYGGVEEDKVFRGETGPNSHREICDSEFGLSSSYRFGRMRILPDGRLLDSDVISSFVKEYILSHTLDVIATEMKIPSAEEMKRKSFTEARLCLMRRLRCLLRIDFKNGFLWKSRKMENGSISHMSGHFLCLSGKVQRQALSLHIAFATTLPKTRKTCLFLTLTRIKGRGRQDENTCRGESSHEVQRWMAHNLRIFRICGKRPDCAWNKTR